MDHAQLQAMMRGEFIAKRPVKSLEVKNRYETEIEREIDTYIKTHTHEFPENSLISPHMRETKIREDLKKTIDLRWLWEFLEKAMLVLRNDGNRYLEAESYQNLKADFVNAERVLDSSDLKSLDQLSMNQWFEISSASKEAIVKIAYAKFEEGQTGDCLALFALLTTLEPGNSAYWFRMGVAAAEDHNLEQAMRCYAAALSIDDHMIEALLFSIKGYLQENRFEEAKAACQQAREISETSTVDPDWLAVLSSLENYITLL